MKATLFSFLAVGALAAPGRMEDHVKRDVMDAAPTQVTIERTGYSGNGCPQGTVSTLLSDDHTVVTFGFDSFQAAIGRGVDPANKQKNCQLHLDLRYPGGFQISVLQATYHGYLRLDEGVTANFISSYYFSQDASHTATSHTVLRGPEYLGGKTYTKSDNIESTSTVWSPCGANGILNVNNRIALTASQPNGTGEISNDDATFKFTQKLRIAWRRCGGGGGGPVPVPAPAPVPVQNPYDYSGGSYSTVSNGGFGGYSDPSSPPPYQGGWPGYNGYQGYGGGGYQAYGPGGVPIGGGFTSTVSKPVDSTVETE